MLKKCTLFLILLLLNLKAFADDNSCVVGGPCGGVSENCERACNNTGSKTFFRPRAAVEDAALFLGLNNYEYYQKYYGPFDSNASDQRIHIARGIFFEKSRNRSDSSLATYFLPHNKSSISIKETGQGDVDSLWLKVITPIGESYDSVLSICPERKIIGGFLTYWQEFECVENSWLEVDFAIYVAEHNLRPRETFLNSARGTVPGATTALEYLSNPQQLQYGKFFNCKRERVGFDDVRIKFGRNHFYCAGNGHFGLYVQALIPIADSARPNAEFIFEPVVGRGHGALGAGFNTAYKLRECNDRVYVWMADASFEYLFKRNERRSFDLKPNGNWSRFLLLSEQINPLSPSAAVNFTTFNSEVTPGVSFNFWTAVHMQKCKWHVEVGYNLWAKQGEKVCLNINDCNNAFSSTLTPGLALPASGANIPLTSNGSPLGILNIGDVCTATTTSRTAANGPVTIATPRDELVADAVFTPVTFSDIDLNSAGHPRALSNKIYASLAYDALICERPVNIGVSGSYEFAHDRNALEQWGVWGTVNVEF